MKRQAGTENQFLLVVDASDPPSEQTNKATVKALGPPHWDHLSYTGSPSLTRQRNAGLDALPSSVETVFFLDDDVTLQPGYTQTITRYLKTHPDTVGVGGYDPTTSLPNKSALQRFLRYLFLLDHPQPGRILPSGEASSPQSVNLSHPIEVHWLPGFTMTYRRTPLCHERFDETLQGYSHLEDRDLSLRMRQHGTLVLHPKARLVHRKSSVNRHDAEEFAHSLVTHLFWLVEKNSAVPLRKSAFWWSTLGRILATLSSRSPQKWGALRGPRTGIRAVLCRSHPLLDTS